MAAMLRTVWTLFFFINWPDLLSAQLSSDLTFTPDGGVHAPFEDSSFFISCSAGPGSHAVQFLWYHPIDGPIKFDKGRVHVETNVNTRGVDLIFEKVRMSDKGNYTCTASFGGKEVTRRFELKVYKHINFVNTPDVQEAQEGTDALVRCEAEAEPVAQVTWKFKDNVTSEPKFVANSEGLMIRNVTKADAGNYLCRAFQFALSNFKEKFIEVKVLYKPSWKSDQSEHVYSFIGGKVNLSCEADGEPQPTYVWEHDDEEIIEDQNKKIFEENGKSVLQISVEDESDFSYYRCTASNAIGSINRTLILNRGAKPGVPNIALKRHHQNKIELDIIGPNSDNLKVISYRVEYRKDSEPWDQANVKEFKTDELFVVDELQHDTMYFIRVAAKNAAGFGDYTKEMSQKTQTHHVESPTNSGWSPAVSSLLLGVVFSALGL